MVWLPHRTELLPEAYEHLPALKMAFKGFRNELRISPWSLRHRSVNRFVVFAQGRTGSTLLTSTLDRHSQVCCADEILGVPRLFPKAFVENAARASGASNYGFHVKIYQLAAWQRVDDVRDFLHGLSSSGWKIIYLKRQNLLRQAVSNVFAESAGAYHDVNGTQQRPETIDLPLDKLFHTIASRGRQRNAELAALEGLNYLSLCYETDLEAPETQRDAFLRVQEYLELEQEELLPGLRKMVNKPLREVVRNYAEVAAALSGRPEAIFLDDK